MRSYAVARGLVWALVFFSVSALVGCDGDDGRNERTTSSNNSNLETDGGALAADVDFGAPLGSVDKQQLGAPCNTSPPSEPLVGCADGQVCAMFPGMGIDSDFGRSGRGGYCVPSPACSVVTCQTGLVCDDSRESYPVNVMCVLH